jgi:O-antigen ligase
MYDTTERSDRLLAALMACTLVGLVILLGGISVYPRGSVYHTHLHLLFYLPGILVLIMRPRWQDLRLVWREGLVMGAFMLSLLVAQLYPGTVKDVPGDLLFVLKVSAFVLIFLHVCAWRPERIKTVLWLSLVITATASAFRWVDFISSEPTGGLERLGFGIPLARNPIYYAAVQGALIIVAIELANTPRLILRIGALSCVLIMVATAFETGTRSFFLAFALAMLARCSVMMQWRHVIAFVVAIVIILLLFANVFPGYMLERGYSLRDLLWAQGVDSAMNSPVFGHGSAFVWTHERVPGEIYYEPHNLYISMWIHFGAMVTILMLMMFGTFLLRSIRAMDHFLVRVGFTMLVFGMVMFLFEGPSIVVRPGRLWLQSWIPCAFILGGLMMARKTTPDVGGST